ncbi:hypothetical protein JHK85_004594 [Glycine max]|nr:hypothetical protein JHK85_004594 [Glycine max]
MEGVFSSVRISDPLERVFIDGDLDWEYLSSQQSLHKQSSWWKDIGKEAARRVFAASEEVNERHAFSLYKWGRSNKEYCSRRFGATHPSHARKRNEDEEEEAEDREKERDRRLA